MDDVTTDIVIDDGGRSGRNHRTVLRLGWSRRDPLAVTLWIAAEPDHPALPRGRWSILRDFLRWGMDRATGEGDVRVRPSSAGGRVVVELDHDGRTCVVRVPAQAVSDFLDATEAIVPAGEERNDVDMDQVIERLLHS